MDALYFHICGLQNQLLKNQQELMKMHKTKSVGKEPEENGEELGESNNQEEQLLDKVPENPLQIIQIVFDKRDMQSIREDSWEWLQAAIANNNSSCEDGNRRFTIMELYRNILTLVEALFLINEQHKPHIGDRSTDEILQQ